MKTLKFSLILLVAFSVSILWAQKKQVATKHILKITFEDVATGTVPADWKVEGTRQRGPLATWQVTEDKTAPSGKKVLTLTSPNHTSGGTFNLCWTKGFRFTNGMLSVHFKANSGREDQGGGILWRAQDKDNYYVARFNPLEDNFRLYTVKKGVRRMLKSARVHLPAHVWHTMKIVQKGDKITAFLNGKKYLELNDETFTGPGGVGLWTKADAATSFDDFIVN
jgi:hypothetical protein